MTGVAGFGQVSPMVTSPSPTGVIVDLLDTLPSVASPSLAMDVAPPTPGSIVPVPLIPHQQSSIPLLQANHQLDCFPNSLETPLSPIVVQHEPGEIYAGSTHRAVENSLMLEIDGSIESQIPFIPLQGAWKKPLLITTEERDSELHGDDASLSLSQWPSRSVCQKLTKRQMQDKSNQVTKHDRPLDDITCSKRIEDDTVAQRFPWAAKMNPTTRNLYRATSPTYMDDGTPKVQIPNHALLKGLENQKEFIIGQFYRCSTPSAGLIHALVNKIWGRKCKIFIRKGESSYMFHISDKSTRTWVIQRGLWHLDDCLMFVAPWSPITTLALPEISTMPVWITLKNIPNQLYSIQGISWIASGLGAPMATNKPRLDPTLMGEAKILVEVELHKPFP